MKKIIACWCLFLNICFAGVDIYSFSTPQQKEQFAQLNNQLRCLVCQNQTIAESNAELASDLREIIYQKIRQGKSNQQITGYLVARYGDYILYRPPFNSFTALLWLGPLLFLSIGLCYLVYFTVRMRR